MESKIKLNLTDSDCTVKVRYTIEAPETQVGMSPDALVPYYGEDEDNKYIEIISIKSTNKEAQKEIDSDYKEYKKDAIRELNEFHGLNNGN